MNNRNLKAFSLIEVLIGIFIFTLGVISVYALIVSTLRLNDYNKNYIIATNLAREQIEQVRNIRDSNYKKIHRYNKLNPGTDYVNDDQDYFFGTGKVYKIENNFENTATFPIDVTDITDNFDEGESMPVEMENYRLYLDSDNRYTYNSAGTTPTRFYKYISVDEVKYTNGTTQVVEDALLIKSKVIWNIRGYNEFEVKSIITDWKRL